MIFLKKKTLNFLNIKFIRYRNNLCKISKKEQLLNFLFYLPILKLAKFKTLKFCHIIEIKDYTNIPIYLIIDKT